MNSTEQERLYHIIQKIKCTNHFQTYFNIVNQVNNDKNLLLEIADYQVRLEKQTQYNSPSDQQTLLALKQKIFQNESIKIYFQVTRKIDLFLDDLNFEINKLFHTKKTDTCKSHKKQNSKFM